MKRLDFLLPDFVRVSWNGDPIRTVWEPRIQRVRKAWMEIEWLSILSGVRRCCVAIASPQHFLEQAARWTENGLSSLPMEMQGLSNATYTSTRINPEFGKPFVFRIVVGKTEDVALFKKAYEAGDENQIGTLLGYPRCCQDFFRNIWVEQGMIDTTWPMAQATAGPGGSCEEIEVYGPAEANILWRWMGIRAVPHLPCSFACQPTVDLGKTLMAVGRESGFRDEMAWLSEMLSWSVEWSAYRGIAQIKTPILTVSTRTDATSIKYRVIRQGQPYFERDTYGESGLAHHLNNECSAVPSQEAVASWESCNHGAESPPGWYASDNGFRTELEMDQAHRPIVELAMRILSDETQTLLDLGCGNGALLKKILMVKPKVIPYGIDADPERIEHARILITGFADHFITGDIFEAEQICTHQQKYDIALLMPGRLLEVRAKRAERLRDFLRKGCKYLLVYAYGDWLTRYNNLQGLAPRAGLRLLSLDEDAPAGLARV